MAIDENLTEPKRISTTTLLPTHFLLECQTEPFVIWKGFVLNDTTLVP